MSEENKPAPSSSLFNFGLGDLLGLGKAVEKLAAAVGGGLGRAADGIGVVANVKWLDKARANNEAYRAQVVGEAQTRVMEGRARAVAALTQAGQQVQGMSITEGSVSAQLVGVPPAAQALYERTQRRMLYENAMQQINREAVVAHATAELQGDDDANETPVDPDWMSRFFRTVQDISSDQLHLIFGKILAGETKQPGTFSARMIDFIATLTTDEAIAFRELCAFTWHLNKRIDIILFGTETEGYAIKIPAYSTLQDLRDIGLIDLSYIGDFAYNVQELMLSYNGSPILIEAKKSDVEPSIEAGIITLTKTGRELARVCQPELDPCIMEYAMNHWMLRGYKLSCPLIVAKPGPLPTTES